MPAPESAVSRIHVGAPVTLNVQSLRKRFTGTIARFADRLDTETRTMRVEVDVPNPTLDLVPGMYADASIVLDEARDAVVAPIEAIDRTEASARVLVVNARGLIEERNVRLGLESGDRVQIVSGLAPNEFVVVGNRAQLKAGAVVTPKVTATASAAEEGPR
jgi:RND family efflux transporter MFP subunit